MKDLEENYNYNELVSELHKSIDEFFTFTIDLIEQEETVGSAEEKVFLPWLLAELGSAEDKLVLVSQILQEFLDRNKTVQSPWFQQTGPTQVPLVTFNEGIKTL